MSPRRMSASLLALLALTLAGGCSSALADAVERGHEEAALIAEGATFIEPYSGKYAVDPRLAPALERLRQALPRAIDNVRKRLDADAVLPSMAIGVVDAETTQLPESARISVKRREGNTTAVVLFAAEELVPDTSDVEETLTHEFVHALHICGGGGVEAPLWLCEGLARWVESASDDESERWILSRAISYEGAVHQTPIGEMIASEQAMEDADDRGKAATGFVFFFALERTRGREFVRSLAVRLLRAEDWRATIETECGRPFPAVLTEAHDAYIAWSKTIEPSALILEDATRRNSEGDVAGAATRLDSLLSADSRPALRPYAEFARWRMHWASGDLQAATAVIHAFQSKYPHDDLVTGSRIDEFSLLVQQGRKPEAATVASRLLLDALWRPEHADRRKYFTGFLAEFEGTPSR